MLHSWHGAASRTFTHLATALYRISTQWPAFRERVVPHSLPKPPVRAGRSNVNLMSPASAAPGRPSPGHLRSKHSLDIAHDVNAAHPTASAQRQAVEEDRTVTRARGPPKLRTKTSPSALRVPPSLHDAVRPQLSERDSIFATHYIPSTSPVTSPLLGPETAYKVEGDCMVAQL